MSWSSRRPGLFPAGGSADDQGFDIAFDASRNVYLTGTFTDSATFHGTNGSAKTVTGNAQTIFLAKYNPSGVLLWVQTGVGDFGGSNNGYGVAIDSASGSVYMTGMGQGDIAFSASDGTTSNDGHDLTVTGFRLIGLGDWDGFVGSLK